MQTTPIDPMLVPESSGEADDVFILVHGTFSGEDRRVAPDGIGTDDAAEDDTAWWQVGSALGNWFAKHLAPGGVLTSDSVISFAWSGRNSQVSRLEAGNELLARLLYLERQGRNYHLIGHSHGGSVVWEALISSQITLSHRTVFAELRRAMNKPHVRLAEDPIIPERFDEYAPPWFKYKTRYIPRSSEFEAISPFIELRGLRSWTTVGTPFMRYFPARRPLVRGWPSPRFSLAPSVKRSLLGSLLIDLVLLVSVSLPFYVLATMIVASFSGASWMRSFMDGPVTNALAMPYLVWWVTSFYLMSKRSYADILVARERAAQRAYRRFGGRWLGLWSPRDEAINSLTALTPRGPSYEWACSRTDGRADRPVCLDNGGLPMPKLALRTPVTATHLLPDNVRVAPLRVTAPVVWLANRWLGPLGRRWIARRLTRTCQGSDLPAAVLAFVSPWPLPLARARAHHGLPPEVDARLERNARHHSGELGPAVRQMLMTAALEGVPAAVDAVQDGPHSPARGALVHTSYFDDEDVRRLISLHISRTRTDEDQVDAPPADDGIGRWLATHWAARQAEFDRFFAQGDQTTD